MRILFLDDDKQRLQEFADRVGYHDITLVETPGQAMEALERGDPFDVVSLDHDLFGKVYQPSDIRSGYAVCEYLNWLPREKLPNKIICHSFNENGVKAMMEKLASFCDAGKAERFGTEAYWNLVKFVDARAEVTV